jgi:hypothetical protein
VQFDRVRRPARDVVFAIPENDTHDPGLPADPDLAARGDDLLAAIGGRVDGAEGGVGRFGDHMGRAILENRPKPPKPPKPRKAPMHAV